MNPSDDVKKGAHTAAQEQNNKLNKKLFQCPLRNSHSDVAVLQQSATNNSTAEQVRAGKNVCLAVAVGPDAHKFLVAI